MDRYRSPQFSMASLQISSPRSLRPRDNRRTEQRVERYEPQPTHPPVIPIELIEGRPANQAVEDSAYATGAQDDLDYGSSAPSDVESSAGAASPGRRLLDGFVGGFGRISRVMAKHHSRESLYQEYLSEGSSEGAASQTNTPRYRYASTVLSDIPETSAETETSPRPHLPRPQPFQPFAVIPDTVPMEMVSSPTYTNSALESRNSKDVSIDIPLPPEDTWAYYIRRVQIVLIYVWNLPWSSARIVNDYVPARDGRSRYNEKPRVPWYTPRGGATNRDEEKLVQPAPVIPEFFILPPTPTTTLGTDLAPPRFPLGADVSFSSGVATAFCTNRFWTAETLTYVRPHTLRFVDPSLRLARCTIYGFKHAEMLITKTYHDVPSALDNGRPIRIFIIAPTVPGYPNAKFPGVVCFSEIYQVTGPVERFAGQIASQGFVVGTDRGNKYKVEKEVAAYDEDATLAIDLLCSLKNCNGRIAATGMCLGGHLAFRAAFDRRVLSSVCFFATDIHCATLGKGKNDDTLVRVRKGDLKGKGELVMIFGKQDTHVPREGRDLIRKTLEDADVPVSFLEVQAQHAFIRDESSKGRWDAALTRSLFTFMMEVFERTVGRDLGEKVDGNQKIEHVC
ncbi:hypothetical protein NM688_g4355 [Phlebia brevispora]|uniref:Uncharacterized protein n=1 Tax=Phlebia brevispora TaxID=194682 RepID=A0ACC1T3A2_9APHY|nr:hypothetical protein NM688_g4355 [Phlebia brevispora]